MAYYPYSPNFSDIYTLTNSDGITAVFNDVSHPSFVGYLTEVTGLDSAEVRESADDLVEADGGQHGYFWLGRRPIVLNGKVVGHATVQQRAAKLDLARRASLALRTDSTLSWKPAVRQENLLPNPSAEVNVTDGGIAGTNAAVVRSTAQAQAGTASFQLTASSAANMSLRHLGQRFAVKAGSTYTASAYFRAVATPRNCVVSLDWYDATGTRISIVGGTPVANTTTGWTRASYTGVAPAGAVTAQIIAEVLAPASAEVHYIDAMMVNPGALAAYFDGATAGYIWQGNAHNSASGDYIEMYTPVRRQQPWRETGGWNKDFQCALVSQYAPIFSVAQKSVSGALSAALPVENRGNYGMFPVVQITGGNLANPTVTSSLGPVFTTAGQGLTIAASETLEVDFLNHTARFTAGARVGTSGNRYINFGSTNWPCILSGTSTLTLGGTGTGSMTVLWRDAWA
jgi:hypothetical protein